jgi:hypothetical protein
MQYGKAWDHCPTTAFIFAYDSIDLDLLAATMAAEYVDTPPEERLDGVWVLGKGYLNWFHPLEDRILVSPEPDSKLAVQDSIEEQDILLNMTLVLNAHFGTAWMPPFRLLGYSGHAPMANRRSLWTIPAIEDHR